MNRQKTFWDISEEGAVYDLARKRNKIFSWLSRCFLIGILMVFAWKVCDVLWLRHRYLITAYCDCPICINVEKFRDGKFASRQPLYWGGVATDKSIPFGSSIELVAVMPWDWWAIRNFLDGRRLFTVEDRGGKIDGRHIDIFFPQERGGHAQALRWGVRRMRVKINGRLMD